MTKTFVLIRVNSKGAGRSSTPLVQLVDCVGVEL